MNSLPPTDGWTHDTFEDAITRAMVALYETQIDPLCAKSSRISRFTQDDLQRIRKYGVTIPAPDREFLFEGDGCQVDALIPTLPAAGSISFGEDRDPNDPDHLDSYCTLQFFRQVPRLPGKVVMTAPGLIYEVLRAYPQDHHPLLGIRSFVTVNPHTRRITPCLELGHRSLVQMRQAAQADPSYRQNALALNFGMQIVDDFQHQWRITAQGEDTKVTIGAYAENVKSLLYARSLPMTPSGRKRPILHVVRAHKRRLEAGTEIDITQFLRGTRQIEMDGTRFTVEAPQKLIDELLAKKAA